MKIKELHDELGEGIGAYIDGKFFEIRFKEGLQSRIYGDNNDCKAIILVVGKGGEGMYNYFKLFAERITRLFEINIGDEEEDFIRYLNKGFEKSFGSGRIRVNPTFKGLKELRKYASGEATKYGLLAETLGWTSLIIGTCANLKVMAVLMGFYFVFGDVICGLLISWLADLGIFSSPFFQLGAYPAGRRFLRKYIFLNQGLLSHFKRRAERMKKLEERFIKAENVEKKSSWGRRMEKENQRLARKWEPVALSFARCNEFKGVIVEYKGRYQDSFAFCNYIINAIEPKEEELDVWHIPVEEPQGREEKESDFDKIWKEGNEPETK